MFNIEEFKTALKPFGTLTYAKIFDEGLPSENLEFAVATINYLYAVSNFGTFTINQILPYYPNLVVLSMDNLRLKGVFKV
jgi:hypothetical protein